MPFLFFIICVIVKINKDSSDKRFAEQALAEQDKIDYFKTTRSVSNLFCIDEKRKKWAIPQKLSNCNTKFAITKNTKIYSYSDIISYQLIEETGSSTTNQPHLFVNDSLISTPTCSKIQIIITVNNIYNPNVYIEVFNFPYGCKKTSRLYLDAHKTAQDIISILKIITNNKNDSL